MCVFLLIFSASEECSSAIGVDFDSVERSLFKSMESSPFLLLGFSALLNRTTFRTTAKFLRQCLSLSLSPSLVLKVSTFGRRKKAEEDVSTTTVIV